MLTEIDGVPTLYAPMDGPIRAGLVFRVGQADETLATSGITHLVEHLALHGHGLSDYHFNAQTRSTTTLFHVRGSESDLATYLTAVCEALADLPLDRMETEKAILRTESANQQRPLLPLWRHGAVGFGLVSFPEWGLSRLTPDDVRRWADTWFTRDNAALWVTGPRMPKGLRLPLPAGTRRRPPEPSSALPHTPAWFASGEGGLTYQGVVARCAAASLFAHVLDRVMYRTLRMELGASYTAGTSYDVLDAASGTITAYADSLPEKQDAVLGEFVDLTARFRIGRFEDDDIAAARARTREALTSPDIEAMCLPAAAVDLLLGRPETSAAQLLAEVEAVTPDQVHAVAVEMIESALLQVPDGRRADWAGFAAAPVASDAAVDGARYASREDAGTTLVLGGEGVSRVGADHVATVRYGDCQAALAWPDGARLLVGSDGIQVRIEPTLWEVPSAALAEVDAGVPDDVVIPMPARKPAAIPRPPDDPARVPDRPVPQKPAAQVRFTGRKANTLLWSLLLAATATLVLGVDIKLNDRADSAGTLIAFFVALVITIACAVQLRRMLKP